MAHLLNLKVMRLSKPSFGTSRQIAHDDIAGQPAAEALLEYHPISFSTKSEHGNIEKYDELGISDFLVLPAAFGNIYLGEKFVAYLSVNNDSAIPVDDVAFKAELQTTSQRLTLANSNSTSSPSSRMGSMVDLEGSTTPKNTSLLPGQSLEFLLNHEIKELGAHILVCSVQYTPSGHSLDKERKFFRKFYKFQVLNPLAVKTRVNTLADSRITLEIQVQNQNATSMYLDEIKFEQNPLFDVKPINALKDVDPFKGVLDSQNIRQYLYLLSPKNPTDLLTKTTPNLGKLDIVWTSYLGIPGRLQTSQLVRKVPIIDPFDISILEQPEMILVEKPFHLQVRIRNNLPDEKLRLTIRGIKSKMSQVLIYGSNQIDLGLVDPQGFVDFKIGFFSLVPGHHKISGLLIEDKLSGAKKDVDCLAAVHVF